MPSNSRPRPGAAALILRLLPAVFLAAFLLSPHGAAADEAKGRPSTQVAATASPKITKEEATQAALLALPGNVTDVTIERKRGKMVYVIEIVAASNGAETDVLVDMDTGKVLGMDR